MVRFICSKRCVISTEGIVMLWTNRCTSWSTSLSLSMITTKKCGVELEISNHNHFTQCLVENLENLNICKKRNIFPYNPKTASWEVLNNSIQALKQALSYSCRMKIAGSIIKLSKQDALTWLFKLQFCL